MKSKDVIESLKKPFLPLKHHEYQKKFLLYSIVFLVLFNLLSNMVIAVLLKDFEGNVIDRLIFAFAKNISLMRAVDWVFFIIGSVLASLMLINYQYNKCSDKKSVSAVFLGAITATCPACIIPIIGIASITTFIGTYNYAIKLGIILLIFSVTIYVANKNECNVGGGKKRK